MMVLKVGGNKCAPHPSGTVPCQSLSSCKVPTPVGCVWIYSTPCYSFTNKKGGSKKKKKPSNEKVLYYGSFIHMLIRKNEEMLIMFLTHFCCVFKAWKKHQEKGEGVVFLG